MSSSNPITSVPDPSQSSALASVITQVQPGQVPAGARGPARPNRTAKSNGPNKKKKKKKAPTAAAAPSQSVDAAQTQDPVAAAALAGATDASQQSQAQAAPTADIKADADADDAQVQHSHQHSTTLVAASTPGNTLTPADAQNADLTKAVEKLASESSQGTIEKDTALAQPLHSAPVAQDATTTKSEQASRPAAAAATSAAASSNHRSAHNYPKPDGTGSKKKKQAGFISRLVAVLTCSGGAAAMAHEEMNEKQGAGSRTAAAAQSKRQPGLPASVVVPPRTPIAKGGSRSPTEAGSPQLGSTATTTPGGGTRLPREETGDVMSGAVVPPGSSYVGQHDPTVGLGVAPPGTPHRKSDSATGDDSRSESDLEDEDDEDDEDDDDLQDDDMDLYLDDDAAEEQRLIMQGGMGIPVDAFGNPMPLLQPIIEDDAGRKCLVLDLDETLVHSSFKMIQNADFIVPVEIEGTVHNVYVIKRPGVDEFMRRMGEIYEVVVFTASLSKYADPVLDMLDIHRAVRHRLFRESCYNHRGNYVKDLSQLGRDIADTIIIDNSPASYIFHPNNAVPISSWFNDPHDTELTDLCPFLADLSNVDDVRAVLDGSLLDTPSPHL